MKNKLSILASLVVVGFLTVGCGSGGVKSQSSTVSDLISDLPDTSSTIPNVDTTPELVIPTDNSTYNPIASLNDQEKIAIDAFNEIRSNSVEDMDGNVLEPVGDLKFNKKISDVLQEYLNEVPHSTHDEAAEAIKIFGDDLDGDGVYDVDNNQSILFKEKLAENGLRMGEGFVNLVSYGEDSDVASWFSLDNPKNYVYFSGGKDAVCGLVSSLDLAPEEFDGVIEDKAMIFVCGVFVNN